MSGPGHSPTCDNCGKRVLPTDTLCWHCGWKLSPTAAPIDLTLGPRSTATSTAPTLPAVPPTYDLRAIAVYGALTLLVLIALLLVMRALGQRPLLVNSGGLDLPDDWTRLTDSQLRYTLGVPGGWQWLDVPFRDQQAVLADLLERQPAIARALRPLGDTAGDLTIEGVAAGTQTLELPDPVPFVVVATSPALRRLGPQDLLSLLADSPLPTGDHHTDTRLPLQSQARFTVLDESAGYECRHLVATDPSTAAYLVAACAPLDELAATQPDLTAILDSFQLLEQ